MKPTELKLKTCRECGDKFAPPNTIRKVCFKYECQVAAAEKHQAKVEATRAKRERQALREAKERIKKRSEWLADAQKWFNKFIRLRDADKPCISCGTNKQTIQYAAGHFKTVGANPALRFNELNVHKQCNQYCNLQLSGNLLEYRRGLLERIGPEKLAWLEGPHEPKHYSIDDIKELKKLYQRKCKELLTREGE